MKELNGNADCSFFSHSCLRLFRALCGFVSGWKESKYVRFLLPELRLMKGLKETSLLRVF